MPDPNSDTRGQTKGALDTCRIDERFYLPRTRKSPGNQMFPRLYLVGVARIELATPAMSTQWRNLVTAAHYMGFGGAPLD
jgi:hypothetical protein